MAKRSRRDFADYVDDGDTSNEDATLFFPMPHSGDADVWSPVFGGILIGLAGACLVTLLPWLAGALIFGGYGITALALSGWRQGFARALGFGYGLLALTGAAMTLGEIFFPKTTTWLIDAAAQRHVIFLSFAALAWPFALVKYLAGLFKR